MPIDPELLEILACRVDGSLLRRARWLRLRTTRSPRDALLWLRALLRPPAATTRTRPVPATTRPDRPALREVGT